MNKQYEHMMMNDKHHKTKQNTHKNENENSKQELCIVSNEYKRRREYLQDIDLFVDARVILMIHEPFSRLIDALRVCGEHGANTRMFGAEC